MSKVIIIDDGVCIDDLNISCCISSYLVSKTGKVVKSHIEKGRNVSHGTKCANILLEYFKDAYIVSLKVLDNDGKGEIERLIIALEWCLKYSNAIIHLSLTTQNYFDMKKLEPVVEQLSLRGNLIVAALHNSNCISYPAMMSQVICVAMGEENPKRIANITKLYVSEQNKYIYLVGKSEYLVHKRYDRANSFAVPILVAKLLEIQGERKNISCTEAKKILFSMVKNTEKEDFFIKYPNKKGKVSVPVVAVVSDTDKYIKSGIQYFNEKGYLVLGVTEKELEGCVPLSLYRKAEERVEEGTFVFWEHVYSPEIILLWINTTRYNFDKIWNIMSCCLLEKKGFTYIATKKCLVKCEGIGQAFQQIMKFLS